MELSLPRVTATNFMSQVSNKECHVQLAILLNDNSRSKIDHSHRQVEPLPSSLCLMKKEEITFQTTSSFVVLAWINALIISPPKLFLI